MNKVGSTNKLRCRSIYIVAMNSPNNTFGLANSRTGILFVE